MTDLFTHPSFDNHETVLFVRNAAAGLFGIIALHDTTLGPAAGGCRMYPYATTDDALRDVLRLSRGMTMKNALAGLPLGGGKCVIIADPSRPDKPALLRAMAAQVQRLRGLYWTAIDVGVTAEDADIMAEVCDYIFTNASAFVHDDSTAHYTAVGGFEGVRAVAAHLGHERLTGVTVAVQGAGQTGADLIGQLVAAGAQVTATDVNAEALTAVADAHGIRTVAPDEIYATEAEIFAPCALGGILNDDTIPRLCCRGIAGLANNQLDRPEHGRALMDRGIAYAPDFVVNAGGVIRAGQPIHASHDPARARADIARIGDTVRDILRRSEAEGIPTEAIAEAIALDRIAAAKR